MSGTTITISLGFEKLPILAQPRSAGLAAGSTRDGAMQVTSHELAAAASVVAVLSIVGGYLGVRSANRTAVTIAREERVARRSSDLDALKRVVYSEFLVTLSKLADDQMAFDATTRCPQEEYSKMWQRSVDSA